MSMSMSEIRTRLIADITRHNEEIKLMNRLSLAIHMKHPKLDAYCNYCEEREYIPIPTDAPFDPYEAHIELGLMVHILGTKLVYTGNLPREYIKWECAHYSPVERARPLDPRMTRFLVILESLRDEYTEPYVV